MAPPRWALPAAWACLLLAAAAVFFRPDENLLGGWDPAVYLGTGAHIARDGSWLVRDTASAHYTPSEKDAAYGHTTKRFVKYPGFYVDDLRPHTLQPQFFPLYPVWIAFLSLVGGLPLSLFASGLFAWLALLMLLLAAREIGGELCSVVAGAALLLNPVQIWFSGFHTAEIAMQFFFLAGLWQWAVWQRTSSRLAAAAAGGLFALTAFTSVTGVLLAALAAAAHLPGAWKRRSGLLFFAPPLLLAPLFAYQLVAMTPEYLSSVQWSVPLVARTFGRSPILLAGGALALLAGGLLARRIPRSVWRAALIGGAALGAALLAWALYGGAFAESRWLVPASLLSKTGIFCAFGGLLALGWRRPALAPVVIAVPLLFAFAFFRQGLMTAVYPWAFKRWLAVALPMACLFIGYFWAALAAAPRRRVAAAAILALAAVTILRPLYRGREFAAQRDGRGFAGHLMRLNAAIPADGVVVARRELGTPLELICGRTVLPVYLNPATKAPPGALNGVARRWLAEGVPLYVVRDEGETWRLSFEAARVAEVRLMTTALEQSKAPFANRVRVVGMRTVVERLTLPKER